MEYPCDVSIGRSTFESGKLAQGAAGKTDDSFQEIFQTSQRAEIAVHGPEKPSAALSATRELLAALSQTVPPCAEQALGVENSAVSPLIEHFGAIENPAPLPLESALEMAAAAAEADAADLLAIAGEDLAADLAHCGAIESDEIAATVKLSAAAATQLAAEEEQGADSLCSQQQAEIIAAAAKTAEQIQLIECPSVWGQALAASEIEGCLSEAHGVELAGRQLAAALNKLSSAAVQSPASGVEFASSNVIETQAAAAAHGLPATAFLSEYQRLKEQLNGPRTGEICDGLYTLGALAQNVGDLVQSEVGLDERVEQVHWQAALRNSMEELNLISTADALEFKIEHVDGAAELQITKMPSSLAAHFFEQNRPQLSAAPIELEEENSILTVGESPVADLEISAEIAQRTFSAAATARSDKQIVEAEIAKRQSFNELSEQVVNKLQPSFKIASARGKISQMSMRLNPGYLGELTVKLSHDKEKVVALFLVQNQSAKELLEQSKDSLHRSFEKRGIAASDIHIELAQRQFSANDQQQGHSSKSAAAIEDIENARRWLNSIRPDAILEAVETAPLEISGNQLVDIVG